MLHVLLFGACLCILGPAMVNSQKDKYHVRNYPDPIARHQACGRVEPSFICDPTNILPQVKADEINAELVAIYNESTVPCYQNVTRASRRRGYIVMVAVMPEMDRYFTINVTGGYSMQLRYTEAQYFAYHLGQSYLWGKHSSKCDEMVIILFSQADGVLYTSTQPTARRQLTDDDVRNVVLETLTLFHPIGYNRNKAANAIQNMVRKYGAVLREDIAI